MTKRAKYVTNKELMVEIHKSKVSYCSYLDREDANFDIIVSYDDLEPARADEVREALNAKIKRGRSKDLTEFDSIHDMVFRVMTYDHVPLCDDKKLRSRAAGGEGHLRVNFPPFKHYRIQEDGTALEVCRSHWVGGFDNGEFRQDQGRLTNRLAEMFMLLVERYSRRGNWRGYSYNDEMRSTALLQLSHAALLFDEAKGENPFAFYTTTIKNCFTRTLLNERKNQNIRDELLIMAGAKPSYSRQVDDELAARFTEEGVTAATTPIKKPAKRGRKPKKKEE
jgi:hypothetical protein